MMLRIEVGREQGAEQGIGVGQLRVLSHQAARKSGRQTADELGRVRGG